MPETRADCTESTPPRHFSLEISVGARSYNRHDRYSRQFNGEYAAPFSVSPFTGELRKVVLWRAFPFLTYLCRRLPAH